MIWTCAVLVSLAGLASCQYDSPLPPRPVIPGAVALGPAPVGRPVGRVRGSPRRGFTLDEEDLVSRPRSRPPPQSLPPQRLPRPRQQVPQPIFTKPVIEDFEDPSLLQEEPLHQFSPTPPPPPRPTILDDFRPQPTPKPFPIPTPKLIDDSPFSRPAPPRPQQFRNTIQDDDLEIPNRQLPLEPVRGRPQYKAGPPQGLPQQGPARGNPPRQQQVPRPSKNKLQDVADKEHHPSTRPRKPVAQVIRKYREDNEDGSITWGFENDDGTYKEETIGVDCVTRGRYGYVDPDGVKREFTYSSGIPCDKTQEVEDAEQEGSEHGYIDYSNNRYVMPNGDSIDLDHMVKNRARQPVHSQQYYRN